MSSDLIKRAEELDNLRSKGVADKLTLEEAENIVTIWGTHLEHSGSVRTLFGNNIPESLLPYPIAILQGALNKMEAYYYKLGHHDRVKLLERTEIILIQYTNDEEAINETLAKLSNKELREAIIAGVQSYQQAQMQAGYLVGKQLWELSEARIEELLS